MSPDLAVAEAATAMASIAAQAAFLLRERDFEAFAKAAPSLAAGASTPEKFGKLIEKLCAQVKALQNHYREIIDQFRDPEWSVAAGYRWGLTMITLGRSLLSVPMPAGLPDEATEFYLAQLEDVAEPFIKTGESLWQDAANTAQRHQLATIWVERVRDALKTMKPE